MRSRRELAQPDSGHFLFCDRCGQTKHGASLL
jgi:hypothetical protein